MPDVSPADSSALTGDSTIWHEPNRQPVPDGRHACEDVNADAAVYGEFS